MQLLLRHLDEETRRAGLPVMSRPLFGTTNCYMHDTPMERRYLTSFTLEVVGFPKGTERRTHLDWVQFTFIIFDMQKGTFITHWIEFMLIW